MINCTVQVACLSNRAATIPSCSKNRQLVFFSPALSCATSFEQVLAEAKVLSEEQIASFVKAADSNRDGSNRELTFAALYLSLSISFS